jgi:hypothetical protein
MLFEFHASLRELSVERIERSSGRTLEVTVEAISNSAGNSPMICGFGGIRLLVIIFISILQIN